tara:strand:- start:779 stop:2290 length:1512 start_codon:yes stop_codon:yes gene_type:complete
MSKIIKIKDLIKKLQSEKKIIALSHGVFDLIHHGHLRHFEEVKKNCDILIVSVTSDRFVKKGDNRPYFSIKDRLYALSKLENINFVVESDSLSSLNVIKKIKPDLYCKGPDYKNLKADRTKKIYLEKKTVEKCGGKLFVTSSKTSSSSKLINSEYIFNNDQLSYLKNIKRKCNIQSIIKTLKIFNKTDIYIYGEAIIDVYNKLNVLNKSGKESVLNFLETRSSTYLGGVLSVANHISKFVSKISIVTYLGKKKEHLTFIKKGLSTNIKMKFFLKKDSPTIEKKRYIDDYSNKKIIGIYKLNDVFVDTNLEKYIIKEIQKIPKNKLILSFDYGHGFFTKKIIKELSKKNNCFKSTNVQLNSSSIGYHSIGNYTKSEMLCMNELELRHDLRDRAGEINILIKKISKKNSSNYYLITRGKQGVILFNKKKNKFFKAPAFASQVNDKVGAGDSMIPIIALCLMNKVDEDISLLLGSIFSAESIKHEANNFKMTQDLLLNSIETMLKI